MQFLKEGWKSIYEEVLKADITEYELTPTSSGKFNISINGHKLYPDNIDEAIEKQVTTFLEKPSCFFKKPSWSEHSNLGYIHDDLVTDIEKNSPYIKGKENFTDYHHHLDSFFPFILMMGIGSGQHIQELINKAQNIKQILIIDESYELLKVSFHLIDWRPIFRYFKEKNRGLYFVIGAKYNEIVSGSLNTIFKYMPYQFYFIPHYTHYNSTFFTKVKDLFLSKVNLGFSGLGFYDDEVIGLTHTLKNLQHNQPVYRWNNPLPKNSTVFIIGSGPSLDQDIETIKKLSNQAIIFSCGTSLKVLYENDITPDYHLEIERPEFTLDVIQDNLPKEYLRTISMIGLNVIYPEVYKLFKDSKIFFRDNDAGSSVVPEDIPKISHCNPTVVNAAITFASDIGFKNIFLFGTDMGYKDPDNHHSKKSAYYKGSLVKHQPKTLKQEHSGNFDNNEKFFSTDIFLWCKQRVENCIIDYNERKQKNINYFNCSDGLSIARTVPMHSDNIALEKYLNKKEVLDVLESNFDRDFKHLHQEISAKFSQEKDKLFINITSVEKLIKAREIKSFEQFFILIARTFEIINNPDIGDKSYLTRSILKGTMYHFYVSLYTHALAGSNKEASIEYINISLVKFLNFLTSARKKLNSIEF